MPGERPNFYHAIKFKPDALKRFHEQEPEPRYSILTGTSNEPLAEAVANSLGTTAWRSVDFNFRTGEERKFADGEPNIQIPTNIREQNVYIIQPTSPSFDDHSVADHFQELIGMIDAARRGSARDITAIVPYFGYSRSDRKDKPRVPIMAARAARQIQNAGADRMLLVDIHSEQFQGFLDIPVDLLYGRVVLEEALRNAGLIDVVTVSPDAGGFKRAAEYYERLPGKGIAAMFKHRPVDQANVSEVLNMIGDVDGHKTLILDDMIDSAGSLVHAAEYLHKRGSPEIYAAATHGILSKGALERIENSPITKVFITDTIKPRSDVASSSKIQIVTIANLLAEAIRRRQKGQSISELLQ